MGRVRYSSGLLVMGAEITITVTVTATLTASTLCLSAVPRKMVTFRGEWRHL